MSALLGKALSFLGINVHQLVVSAALIVAAYFAGMATANGWATHTAVAAVQTAADKTVAAVKQEERAKLDGLKKQVGELREAHLAADEKSHTTLASGAAAAAADAARIRAALAKEVSNGACAKDDVVVGSVSVRRLLDDAAGVAGYCDGSGAVADDTGGTDRAVADCRSAAELTLGDLKSGYVGLGQKYRAARAQVTALRDYLDTVGLAQSPAGKQGD